MASKDKRAARMRINALLDKCHGCPTKLPAGSNSSSQVEAVCGPCEVYKEMRQLGEFLLKGKEIENKRGVDKMAEPFKMSIKEYVDLKDDGLKDKDIAEMKGVNKQQLYNWKYVRKDQIKAEEEKRKEVKPDITVSTESKVKIDTPVKSEKDWKAEYDKLKNDYDDLARRIDEDINGYKKDIETYKSLISKSRQEKSELLKERSEVSKEIAALKELVRLYL